MFIFRLEHNRKSCGDLKYREGGESITGHGPASGNGDTCNERPNFGHRGSPPSVRMVEYERCAVTAEQFSAWISRNYDYSCYNTDPRCDGEDTYCNWCPMRVSDSLKIPAEWSIVSYWVEDRSEGLDWREDEYQIVFNPAFALLIGPVALWEVEQLAGSKISA